MDSPQVVQNQNTPPGAQQVEVHSTPQPEIKEGNSKLLKILIYVLVAFTLLALGAFGFWFYQEKLIEKPKPSLVPAVTSTPGLLVTPTVKPEATITLDGKISKNEDGWLYESLIYNFKMHLFSMNGEYLWIPEASGNQIIFKFTSVKDSQELREARRMVTVYPVTELDKNNLEKWWSENIREEIGNKNVPLDYNIRNDTIFYNCIIGGGLLKEKDIPQLIEVTEKGGNKFYVSIYAYYDYGKPFVIHFEHEQSGECDGAFFPIISRLN